MLHLDAAGPPLEKPVAEREKALPPSGTRPLPSGGSAFGARPALVRAPHETSRSQKAAGAPGSKRGRSRHYRLTVWPAQVTEPTSTISRPG